MPKTLPNLSDALKDSSRPVFLFGSVPPKAGTTIEDAIQTCAKFTARSSVLATDGFIVYDIQDEGARTNVERPFPFRKTMDAAIYGALFPGLSGKQCVIYKSVVEDGAATFSDWIDTACGKYKHNAFNLVGSPTSRIQDTGLKLHEAGDIMKARKDCAFGCVAIAERHITKGNENINMLRKMEFGADWFITQGVFASGPISKLLNDYGDLCRQNNVVPKKVILTFAPCGRPKTLSFIKWLGMFVPEEVEKRIFDASVPVRESMVLLKEILLSILEATGNSGVPIGINVESLSIFKDEIDAAHDLFQSLQVSIINPFKFFFAQSWHWYVIIVITTITGGYVKWTRITLGRALV